MLGIILIIIFVLLIIWGFWHDDGGLVGVAFFPLVILIIIYAIVYSGMISSEADLTVLDNKVKLMEERNQNSVEQLKLEAQKYVNYEEDIFKNLKPENATILFNAYPNLRTIEAVRYLMEQITRFNDETFKLKLSKEEIRASLLSISNNIFIPFSSKLIND